MYIRNNNIKSGFTLIELIVYLAVSLVIILMLSDIFIICYKSFNKNINRDSSINSIENGIIAIKDMAMDSRVIFKEKYNNSLVLYQEFINFYWLQSIYIKDKALIVEYSERYDSGACKIKEEETIIKNISDFSVYEKGNLLYIKIVKEGEEYITCI